MNGPFVKVQKVQKVGTVTLTRLDIKLIWIYKMTIEKFFVSFGLKIHQILLEIEMPIRDTNEIQNNSKFLYDINKAH